VAEFYPPYLAFPDPLTLFIPRLGFRRCHRYPHVEQILAGQRHPPVVYFAQAGRNIKIGTTANLQKRMRDLYLDLDDVLAVVPGGRGVEHRYHERFRRSHIQADDRTEVFRLDFWLRLYLARCRWTWRELAIGVATGYAVLIWALPFAYGVIPLLLGALGSVMVLGYYFTRPGWDWRRPRWSATCRWLSKVEAPMYVLHEGSFAPMGEGPGAVGEGRA